MDYYATKVINSDFIGSMIKFKNSPDEFHGHMNNFFANFKSVLSNKTINLIREYNSAYQSWSNEQTLLQMANKYDAEHVSDLFDSFNVSSNVDSILRGISKTSISKRKGPSKRKDPSKRN